MIFSKLKNNKGWLAGFNGSNRSGFSGLPGGFRDSNGEFKNIGESGNWWSCSDGNPRLDGIYFANCLKIIYNDNRFFYKARKSWGYSVRCIKD